MDKFSANFVKKLKMKNEKKKDTTKDQQGMKHCEGITFKSQDTCLDSFLIFSCLERQRNFL